MSNKRADISQIKKYLAGKLDAHAMHQLEKQAQDDPFLMDALDGYEKTGLDQQQLNELTSRLQQRVSEKRGRVIPWRMLAMAASVIVVLTVGGLWIYNHQQPQTQPLIAQADKTEVQSSPIIKTPEILTNKDSIIKSSNPVAVLKLPVKVSVMRRSRVRANKMQSATPDTSVNMLSATLDKTEHPAVKAEKKDSVPLNEMLVMGYAAQNNTRAKTLSKEASPGVDSAVASTPNLPGEIAAVSKKSKPEVHPQTGWSSFEKYLNDEAISPDGQTGAVVLQFMVNSDGTLSDFKVIKSLSEEADQKTIALVKNGPGWIGSANGQAKQVTVKVKFHK